MFPQSLQYHVAPMVTDLVKWIRDTCEPVFDVFNDVVLAMLLQMEAGLTIVPWWVWIGLVTILSWYITRHIGKTLTPALLLLTIGMFGLWDVAIETLSIIIVAVIISLAAGIPAGILMAVSERANTWFTPMLDAMQTMPSFVYLIPALMFFGLGKVPAVLATFIYAVPPVQRLTNLGIRQVSESVQEAALAFGATPWQLMREVRLPLALPSILAGVNQTTMMALAMVVICSMIGGGGIGEEVLKAVSQINVGKGFEAGWAIVVLAIVIDRISQGIAQKWDISTKQASSNQA
ncbi:l-proline glycine betaine abc transport system permease protein prow [hydrocarbon metagenome]|uniref:L-proline glycine betaine abc transport system permease protein prow n=1 Tax=hydrocarbon metagenome TaxID=938273 RepID=A0A0W8E201_9ZZZZ